MMKTNRNSDRKRRKMTPGEFAKAKEDWKAIEESCDFVPNPDVDYTLIAVTQTPIFFDNPGVFAIPWDGRFVTIPNDSAMIDFKVRHLVATPIVDVVPKGKEVETSSFFGSLDPFRRATKPVCKASQVASPQPAQGDSIDRVLNDILVKLRAGRGGGGTSAGNR